MQKDTQDSNASKSNKYKSAPKRMGEAELQNKKSVITTNKGVIEIELFGDEAPLTVSNHIFLANDKFYDGLKFHRYVPGFVIQGGDPLGLGFGGPGYQFEDEPVMRQYTHGIVAMANSGPDTNGSQFFIMVADYPLPPQYTIFGNVVKGIEVVDQLREGDQMLKVEIVDLGVK
jgi:cyclophilin family peptidyl-prolyl cis-trans isomerase